MSVALSVDTDGQVTLSGNYAQRLIGSDLIGVDWNVGFATTVREAIGRPSYLYILWDEGGRIRRTQYDIGQPFTLDFGRGDWVRRIANTSSDGVVIFVERQTALSRISTMAGGCDTTQQDHAEVTLYHQEPDHIQSDRVAFVQQRLVELGYALPHYGADGYFGSETAAAVKTFQQANRLVVDGVVGPYTWACLKSPDARGRS